MKLFKVFSHKDVWSSKPPEKKPVIPPKPILPLATPVVAEPKQAQVNLLNIKVKQNIQELIYNLNVPSRWGSQTPFTNLTFDWVCPEDLRKEKPVISGEEMSFTYGDLQEEMDWINRAYMEIMMEGDQKGRVFRSIIFFINTVFNYNRSG